MDHYIIVNTKAFPKLIDAIGGVDINVEKRMHYEDPWDDNGGLVIDLYPGEQHMDGEKAIQYVRYRDGEGDIGRIGRQQKFMKAVLEKLVSPAILPKLPEIVKTCSSVLKTDMSVTELLDFAQQMKSITASRRRWFPGVRHISRISAIGSRTSRTCASSCARNSAWR